MSIKVIQISDTHIRNLKYHDVYRIQFEKIYTKLREIKPDYITLVGDTIDNFVDISNECKLLTGEFLNKLSNIAPVVAVYGNHEVMKSNPKRFNSIKTVIGLLDNDRITCLDKTGFYENDDLIWVNYAYFDKGKIDPWDNEDITIPKNVGKKPTIGLFHDPIYGSVTDTNMSFNSDSYKHISFFDKNDYLFAGDIHKYQILREDGTAAYSSSTIQNSHGETPYNHGFIEWNIKGKKDFTHTFHDIPNDYNFINIYINEGFDYDSIVIKNDYITEYSTVKVIWCDYTPNMVDENKHKILKYIKDKWNVTNVNVLKKIIKTEITDVESINESIDVFNEEQQRKLFREYLLLNKFDDEFINDVLKIDDIINGKISYAIINGVELTIEKLIIDNFKSYDKAEIDFKEMGNNKIIQSSGENAAGKSTILDAICYLLYGKTLSTIKKEKNGDNRFINNTRELDYAYVGGVINISGQRYLMTRKTTRKWDRVGLNITSCPTVITYDKILSDGSLDNQNEEQKKDTQLLIENTIGDFDSFINKCFINSENLNTLLSIDRATFIDGLIRDMGIDIFEQKLEALKEYKKDILSKRSKVDIEFVKKNVVEIKEKKDILTSELETLNTKLSLLDKDRKIKILEKESNISKLEKIDPSIESLDLGDIDLSIETEKSKIQKNEERLELINKLKKDIESYDSYKLDEKQTEIERLTQTISDIKLKLSKLDNELLRYENDNLLTKNKIDNTITSWTNELVSLNKDYESLISKQKESFNIVLNDYTNGINLKLSDVNTSYNDIQYQTTTLINDGKKLKSENDEMESSTVCPTCKRELDGDMTPIHSKVDHNKTEMEILRSKILELKPKSKELEEESEKLKDIINKIKLKDYSFDVELFENYNDTKSRIKEFKENINVNVNILSEIGEGIYSEDLNNLLFPFYQIINDTNVNVASVNKDKEMILVVLSSNEGLVEVLQDELKILKDEKDSIDKKKEKVSLEPRIQSDIDKCLTSIKEYNKQIKDYNSTLDKIEFNHGVHAKINLLTHEIEELDVEISNTNETKTNSVSTINLFKSQLLQYKEDIIEHNRQKKEDEILNTYLKCVHRDGLPLHLLKKCVSTINVELGSILDGLPFVIFFDDDLELRLSQNNRSDISQAVIQSSGFERTFSSICLKFVLSKINNRSKFGLLLLDEIMSKLVGKNIELFSILLENMKKEVDKIIIIEHNHDVNADIQINIIKDDDGISSLNIT